MTADWTAQVQRVQPGDPGYRPELDDIRLINGQALYYDRQGRPLSLRQWVAFNENWEYTQVVRSQLNGVEISTIWIGIDMWTGFPATGQPSQIFETAVKDADTWEPVARWGTEAEAIAGHEEFVTLARAL